MGRMAATGAGLILGVVGWVSVVGFRLWRKFTVDVPGNLFGICRGVGRDSQHPGFTDWLCDQIDVIAGLPVSGPPLTFGQLWAAEPEMGAELKSTGRSTCA